MKKLKLTLPGQTDYLQEIRTFSINYARTLGFKEEELSQIEMAVDEAATNIIRHAYQEDPGLPDSRKFIEIELRKIDQGMEIILRDQGRPYDPTQRPMPDIDKHVKEGRTTGLGVFTMKTFMDNLEYHYIQGTGNEIIMTKYLSS